MIAGFYHHVARPLFFRLDAERAHHLTMRGLAACAASPVGTELLRGLSGAEKNVDGDDPRLARTVFGVRFPNPVGLAAGFDKDGVALAAWEALGFGFVEVGTLTPRPQPGNPRPRLFRLPAQRALINRLGFNNDGAESAAVRFGKLRAAGRWSRVPVGINLGKNKDTPLAQATDDYVRGLKTLRPFADYFALNVSSPNTLGLRGLQNRDELDALLRAVHEANHSQTPVRPILLKIAPDLEFSQIEDILALAAQHGLAGLIATNTTVARDAHQLPPGTRHAAETGGLSGAPLRARATEIVRFVTKTAPGLPVIAVGGVADAASAREKLDAGAALVQLYTGFVYGGPTLVPEIRQGLLAG